MTKSAISYPDELSTGSQEPSARVAPDYQDSDGMDASRLLSVGGLTLDPWQADIIDDWMGRTPSGRWASTTCGISVPRQNGKTGLVQGRAAAGMLMYNEQVVYTAHLQKTATETFEELRAFFEHPKIKKYVREIKTALGREQIILKSGARIKFLARTRNGGRGQHGDLLIFDEAQELDSAQQASFVPAISASLNPQTIYLGTPPDENAAGVVFRGIRQKALTGQTTKAAWCEYSVSEVGDIHNRQRWLATNPALGRRILLSTIETEIEQMDDDTFARERLGWWSPVRQEEKDLAINPEDWEACASSDPKPEGKTAFGVKFSPDGAEVCLSGAVIPKEGPARITLIQRKSTSAGTRWLADWLNERYKTASCVVIDGRNGVDVLVDRLSEVWRAKGSLICPKAGEVIASVSLLTNSLSERTVTWYEPQEQLKESACSSVKRKIGGGWGFGGDDSCPVESCALALWGAKTSVRNPGKKMKVG